VGVRPGPTEASARRKKPEEVRLSRELRRQPLAGQKVVLIIPSRGFRDEELRVLGEYLRLAQAAVYVASSSDREVYGMEQTPARPDFRISYLPTKDFDAFVFVGGDGVAEYYYDPAAYRIAREAFQEGKVLAASCLAPAILARAGVLRGRTAACHPGEKGALAENGARFSRSDLVSDGRIVTGGKLEKFLPYAERIHRALLARAADLRREQEREASRPGE
jgi:protease I